MWVRYLVQRCEQGSDTGFGSVSMKNLANPCMISQFLAYLSISWKNYKLWSVCPSVHKFRNWGSLQEEDIGHPPAMCKHMSFMNIFPACCTSAILQSGRSMIFMVNFVEKHVIDYFDWLCKKQEYPWQYIPQIQICWLCECQRCRIVKHGIFIIQSKDREVHFNFLCNLDQMSVLK